MAGILNLVSPEDMMTPQVGKNPMQAFNDHIGFNQFLRDQGNLSRENYNILGGYDVANRVSPGNPVVGALGNLFGGGAYNLIENFFSKTGTENSPFINDDGSSYNFRTNVTGQPLSEIPGTIFRNALGGSGLISQDLKQKYENLLAEYEGVPANQTNARFTGQNQFQDYPGVENLGGVQNFDLEGVRDIISQMEEEKGNYIERPEDRFNMDGIMQNLGGYAKDAAGRYIGSQALGGAGAMLLGPVGGVVGGIAGLLGGRDLFNSPYIGAGAYTMDQYGNMYTADQLNKMNARGGYYSEPARDSRRRDQSIRRMEERKAQGLQYGINRLDELKQQAAQEEAARQSAVDAYFGGSDAGADSGRFDGASSRSEYDSNPTGYSGPF
jgi:hypothetical protein